MSWEIAGILLSNGIALASLFLSLIGQRGANAKAAAAESAVERSAAAQERMAKTMEDQLARTEREAVRPGAAWALRHFDKQAYVWEQVGRGPAHDVHVRGVDPRLILRAPDPGVVLQPGETIKFIAVRTWGTMDDTVTVTWKDEPTGTAKTFSRPLPP